MGINSAAMGAGMLGGMIGNAIGGPVGRFIGSAVGSGLGQAVTNKLQGRRWDEGLLFNMGLSVGMEGVMAGAERWAQGGAHVLGPGTGEGPGAQLRPTEPSLIEDLAIQRAIEEWRDPNISFARKVELEQFLRAKGARGLWQGGLSAEWPLSSLADRPSRIMEIGAGPVDPLEAILMQRKGERSVLQALHEMYPEAQLGAVDVRPQILELIRTHYIETGLLPESTHLLEMSYTDPELVKVFGQSDLVVNIAPSPDLIAAAGGSNVQTRAMNYVRSLLNLTEPGGRVYVAIDPTTLYGVPGGSSYVKPLEHAFQELAGARPAYHRGGTLAQSRYFNFQGAYSGWINELSSLTWVEYLATRR